MAVVIPPPARADGVTILDVAGVLSVAVSALPYAAVGNVANPVLNTTRFCSPVGTTDNLTGGFATEGDAEAIVPRAMTLTAIYGRNTGAVGAGGAITITVRKNGVDTTLTLSWAAGTVTGTAKSLTGQAVVFAAGDRISVKVVCANTTMPTGLGWGFT